MITEQQLATELRLKDLNILIEESIRELNKEMDHRSIINPEKKAVIKKLVQARILTGAIKHDIELLADDSSDDIDNDLFNNYSNNKKGDQTNGSNE